MSTTPRVVMGKGDWLFHGEDGNYHPGQDFTEAELDQWVELIRHFRDWLAARHIRLVIFITPSKQVVYPELLPAWAAKDGVPHRTEQLVERLRREPNLDVVTASTGLLPARRPESPFFNFPLYYLTDTHWNDLGGYLGARELTRVLQRWYPQIPVPSDEQIKPRVVPSTAGDLAVMLGLDRTDLPDLATPLTFDGPKRGRTLETWPNGDPRITECEGARGPRTVFFRDSFATTMIPNTFQEIFPHAAFERTRDFELGLVDQEKPAVVVWQFIDLRLWEALPNPPFAQFPAQTARQ